MALTSINVSAVFDSLYASLTMARRKVRIGRTIIAKALCSGITVNRESTDQGQFGGIDSNVRLLASDEPGGEIANGTVIEILKDGDDEKTGWIKARTGGRTSLGGITRLILEAEHE